MQRRRALGLLAAAAVSLALAGPVTAQDGANPTVRIESTSIALGIGVTWGDGELTWEGKTYKFDVNGLSVVDLGVSSVTAVGTVHHLLALSDFEGTYVAVQAGAALGGGVSGTAMRNENNVIINLNATQTGAKLTLATEGVSISFAD